MRADTAVAFERTTDQGAVLIAVNAGEESVQMTLPAQTAQQYTVLADELETGGEKAALDGGVLTVPAYGVAVLTP